MKPSLSQSLGRVRQSKSKRKRVRGEYESVRGTRNPKTHRTLAALFTYTKLNTLASYPNRGA